MALKRRSGSSELEGAAEVRRWFPCVPRVGVPEVDRIIDGCKLRKFPTHTNYGERDRRKSRRKPLPRSSNSSGTSNVRDKVDCISRMPDDILQFIISLLTMREAAATSILSTQWRNLWSTSLSCLNFDIPNMIGYDCANFIFENKSQSDITSIMSNFTRWVNQVMQFCPASKLDALRVAFVLNKDFAADIDRWIMSSVARGATDIHLDFHYEKFFGIVHDYRKDYEFPAQQVASTLKYLHLKSCKLHFPADLTSFTSLISLSLSCAVVKQSVVENILSKCPLLEFLSLNDCCYPKGTSFKFAGPYLQLKHLHVGNLDTIESIELHNINLLSFEAGRRLSKLSIKDTPLLERLVLFTSNPVEINNTPRLETLFLLQDCEITNVVSQTYVLKNLKRLIFIGNSPIPTNPLGVVHVLEACHLLEKLELDMGITERSERKYSMPAETLKKLTALPGFPLNKLEEIEIYGFQAYPEKIELAKYLLNNAVVLQKMEIYTTSKNYLGNGRWEPCEDTRKQAATLEEIRNELRNVARPSTKVELFNFLNL